MTGLMTGRTTGHIGGRTTGPTGARTTGRASGRTTGPTEGRTTARIEGGHPWGRTAAPVDAYRAAPGGAGEPPNEGHAGRS
jgi:hypothetical protein